MGLVGESIALILVVKWTIVLALAWVIHATLLRCNPRWRVTLWRATVVGIALVGLLSLAPPIVKYHLADRGQAAVVRSVPNEPAEESRAKAEAVAVKVSTEIIDPVSAAAPMVQTGGGNHLMATSPGTEPAEASGSSWGVQVGPWVSSIWISGVFALIARLMVGSFELAPARPAVGGCPCRDRQ